MVKTLTPRSQPVNRSQHIYDTPKETMQRFKRAKTTRDLSQRIKCRTRGGKRRQRLRFSDSEEMQLYLIYKGRASQSTIFIVTLMETIPGCRPTLKTKKRKSTRHHRRYKLRLYQANGTLSYRRRLRILLRRTRSLIHDTNHAIRQLWKWMTSLRTWSSSRHRGRRNLHTHKLYWTRTWQHRLHKILQPALIQLHGIHYALRQLWIWVTSCLYPLWTRHTSTILTPIHHLSDHDETNLRQTEDNTDGGPLLPTTSPTSATEATSPHMTDYDETSLWQTNDITGGGPPTTATGPTDATVTTSHHMTHDDTSLRQTNDNMGDGPLPAATSPTGSTVTPLHPITDNDETNLRQTNDITGGGPLMTATSPTGATVSPSHHTTDHDETNLRQTNNSTGGGPPLATNRRKAAIPQCHPEETLWPYYVIHVNKWNEQHKVGENTRKVLTQSEFEAKPKAWQHREFARLGLQFDCPEQLLLQLPPLFALYLRPLQFLSYSC